MRKWRYTPQHLTLALFRGEQSTEHPMERNSGTHRAVRQVSSRVGPDVLEKRNVFQHDPSVIQCVAYSYTDYTLPAPKTSPSKALEVMFRN
jgi:hypothetical protein